MFGLFRLYLAMAVVAHHLLRVPEVGGAAVFAFFTLSGFLMTAVMRGTYGYSPAGTGSYLFNRFLRLYPTYWVVIALSALIILITGEPFAQAFNKSFGLPATPSSIAMNISMMFPSFYPNTIRPRLFPIVWTLTVEIFYYVLIGLGVTRSRRTAGLFAGAGLAYHLGGVLTLKEFDFHYHNIFAAALPFGTGGLVYHYRDALGRWLSARATMMLLIHMGVFALGAGASIFNVFVLRNDPTGPISQSISLTMVFASIVISALTIGAVYRPKQFIIAKPLDNFLGKFSYPIYLLHLQTSLLVSFLVFGRRVSGANLPSFIGFGMAMALTLAISFAIILWLEPAIDAIRDRVKQRRQAGRESDADPAAPKAAPVAGA